MPEIGPRAVDDQIPDPVIWDETLRDGEQTPGVHLTGDEKVEIARHLDEAGVDVICCGLPTVSEDEKQSVRRVVREGITDAHPVAAARALEQDVDEVLDTGIPEVSLFVPVSDIHLEHKLEWSKPETFRRTMNALVYALDHGLEVTLVTEDASRADLDFLASVLEAGFDAGAHRAMVCDTVGSLTPTSTRWLFGELMERTDTHDPDAWAFHNHDDFGLATANALSALRAGARCISTTVNGIGERAGNAALEEIVATLEQLVGVDTGVNQAELSELSRVVTERCGVPLRPTKPIVGAYAFRYGRDPFLDPRTEEQAPPCPKRFDREPEVELPTRCWMSVLKEREPALQEVPDEVLRRAAKRVQALHQQADDLASSVRQLRARSSQLQGLSPEEVEEIARSVVDFEESDQT